MLIEIFLYIFGFNIIEEQLLNKNYNPKTINYIISDIHAISTFTISSFYLLNLIQIDTYTDLIYISTAYAIYDTNIILCDDTPGKFFLVIHHLMIIIVNLYVNYVKDFFVIEMMAYNYLTEFTTPFLNLSLYLYKSKKTDLMVRKYNLFNYCNGILVVSFFIFRILLGFYLVKINIFYNFLSYFQVIMLGMNIYWFQKLISKIKVFTN
jgi:hypothetical protein